MNPIATQITQAHASGNLTALHSLLVGLLMDTTQTGRILREAAQGAMEDLLGIEMPEDEELYEDVAPSRKVSRKARGLQTSKAVASIQAISPKGATISELVRNSGVSRSTVRRALTQLEAEGWVVVVAEKRERSRLVVYGAQMALAA